MPEFKRETVPIGQQSFPPAYMSVTPDLSRDLPIDLHPYSLALPIWGEPGIFRSASIDAASPEALVHFYHWMPPNLHETLGIAEDANIQIESTAKINAPLFARGIAKIA